MSHFQDHLILIQKLIQNHFQDPLNLSLNRLRVSPLRRVEAVFGVSQLKVTAPSCTTRLKWVFLKTAHIRNEQNVTDLHRLV